MQNKTLLSIYTSLFGTMYQKYVSNNCILFVYLLWIFLVPAHNLKDSGISGPYIGEFGRQAFLDDHLRNGKRVLTAKFWSSRHFTTIKMIVKHFLDVEIWSSSFSLTIKFDRQATNFNENCNNRYFQASSTSSRNRILLWFLDILYTKD